MFSEGVDVDRKLGETKKNNCVTGLEKEDLVNLPSPPAEFVKAYFEQGGCDIYKDNLSLSVSRKKKKKKGATPKSGNKSQGGKFDIVDDTGESGKWVTLR